MFVQRLLAAHTMTDRIKVCVRLRPTTVEGAHSTKDGYEHVLSYSDHRLVPLMGKEAERGKDGYIFQRVFAPDAMNRDVYNEVSDITSAALEGISGTILAYGQTATGKTHTMRGSPHDAGISELLVTKLFDEIGAHAVAGWQHHVEVAYIEIYNDKVFDLLTGSGNELDLRDAPNSVNIVGLQYTNANTAEDAKAALLHGEENRRKTKTDYNERSSRSHTVFRIQVNGVLGQKKRRAVLHLVDLAGSENAKAAGYTDDTKQREGSAINRSLLALTNVINNLADKTQHVSYRSSKLTRILSNSLGGTARTYLICCITSVQKYFAETMSTIHFANRARVVYNSVKVNEENGVMSVPWTTHQQLHQLHLEDIDDAKRREHEVCSTFFYTTFPPPPKCTACHNSSGSR